MEYKKRVIDDELLDRMEAFGAILIVGPKGCGKTTTAKHIAKSVVEFEDTTKRDNLLLIAKNAPDHLLLGDKPRLFDEWQDAPNLWLAIRKDIDDSGKKGQYLLTGSTSRKLKLPHTGTLRISRLQMYPMSLYETEESNGTVSLKKLFDAPNDFVSYKSDLSKEQLTFDICKGGWPSTLNVSTDKAKLTIAKDLFKQTYSVDIQSISNKRRKKEWAKSIIQSYSRNICTLASFKTIHADTFSNNTTMSETTCSDYIEDLKDLYIIEDIEAWNPAIRSKTVIRASKKRNLIDPSIAVAALGLSPESLYLDFKTLGFLFESLCIRDLKIYSSRLNGNIGYYRDRSGLESDCVLSLDDGRYALIEFKLGSHDIDLGAKHLNKIESLIQIYNDKQPQCPLRKPDLKIIITADEYGYKREDGVFVIPIGCLKD